MERSEQEKTERIKKILDEQGLKIINEARVKEELKDRGIRFFHILTKNQEGEERFVKILNPENEEARSALVREVVVHSGIDEQLRNNPDAHFKARRFIKGEAGINKGEVYLTVDSFPRQEKVGFIESEEGMEKLTPQHARKCVDEFLAMRKDIDGNKLLECIKNQLNLESPEEAREVTEGVFDDYNGYKEDTRVIMSMHEANLSEKMDEGEKESEITTSLQNHGQPEDMEEILENIPDEYKQYLNRDNKEFGVMPLWMTMEKRLGSVDLRSKVEELFNKYEETVKAFQQEDKHFLVHGDSCPRNTFYRDSGEVEFSDWGHAGVTKNELLALIYDFGNMRARAWNNKEYREALDQAVIKHYHDLGQEDAGKAVVALGILRSHCCLAGFFENYDASKQRLEQQKRRKENTEQDVRKAFEIAGIEL